MAAAGGWDMELGRQERFRHQLKSLISARPGPPVLQDLLKCVPGDPDYYPGRVRILIV